MRNLLSVGKAGILFSLILAANSFLGCTNCEKAVLQPCKHSLPKQDVVFILDQSGTMSRNDPSALRWEAIQEIINAMLREEAAGGNPDVVNRFTFVPFGKSETEEYNTDLRWYTKHEAELVHQRLYAWIQKAPIDTASYSDFLSPLTLVADRLQWRQDALPVIFFITDGKYNVRPDKKITAGKVKYDRDERQRERREFNSFLASLRELPQDWQIFFAGVGLPGYDKFGEPNVNQNNLRDMAATRSPSTSLSKFSVPAAHTSNLLLLVSSNTDSAQRVLRQEVEGILRMVRFAAGRHEDEHTFLLPAIPPDLLQRVEIEAVVKDASKSKELERALRLFVEVADGREITSPLRMLDFENGVYSSRIHRFSVDFDFLNRNYGEWMNLEGIQRWGVQAQNGSGISLSNVNLIIRDNWTVFVDSCIVMMATKSRSWMNRLFHIPEKPAYKLALQVRAVHPCDGRLPCGHLSVRIGDNSVMDRLKPVRVDTLPHAVRADGSTHHRHTYLWQLVTKSRSELTDNTGKIIDVGVTIDDLYACSIQIPSEVPLNARHLENSDLTASLND